MKILQSEIEGIKFYYREGFSDLKTFEEVLGRKVYLKKGMTIAEGERWMDCGGNVGADKFDCCKMDIEGAEMLILENTQKVFDKLVYEWSFDIDKSLPRFWAVVESQQLKYKEVRKRRDDSLLYNRSYDQWQDSWFPACENVYAFNK